MLAQHKYIYIHTRKRKVYKIKELHNQTIPTILLNLFCSDIEHN